MLTLSPEGFRAIRAHDLHQSTAELGARLFRAGDGEAAVVAFEAGTRAVPVSVTFAMLGFQMQARAAQGLGVSASAAPAGP